MPPPKDVHDVIPRTCEYMPLCGKRNFAHVITAKDLEMGGGCGGQVPGLTRWAQSNHVDL